MEGWIIPMGFTYNLFKINKGLVIIDQISLRKEKNMQ